MLSLAVFGLLLDLMILKVLSDTDDSVSLWLMHLVLHMKDAVDAGLQSLVK